MGDLRERLFLAPTQELPSRHPAKAKRGILVEEIR
jgi:hypothetical protein